jgi:uncharacterized membrane protein
MSFRKKEDDMSTNPNQGQNPDQTNSYGGYGGYSGGGQQAPSSQPSYDPNDPYADPSAQQGAASGYGQQQTGYDQQQQQQTYYQPPASATQRQRSSSTSTSSSTMKMDPNRAALFSYALGWLSGLVFLFMERKNSFVRFSAAQSILFFGGITIIRILFGILSAIPILGPLILAPILGFLTTIITIIAVVAWIFLMYQAYRGVKVKIPIVQKRFILHQNRVKRGSSVSQKMRHAS